MYPQADPAAAGWHCKISLENIVRLLPNKSVAVFIVYSQIWAVDYDSWSIFPVDETIRQSHPIIFLPAPDDPIYILNLIFRVHAMGEQFILMRQDNFAINGWVCETLHTSYGDAHACLPIPPESIVTPSHITYPQTASGDLDDYVDEDEGYDEEYDDYPRQTLQHTLVGFSREQVDPASPFTPEMGPEPHTNIHAHDFSLFAPIAPAEQYPNPNNVHVHNAAHVVHSSNSSVSGDTVDSLTIYGAPPTKASITRWVDEVKTKRLPRKCPLSNCRQTEFRRPHALKVSQILVVQ